MKDYSLDRRELSSKLRIRIPNEWTTDLAQIAERKGMTLTTYLQAVLQAELINHQTTKSDQTDVQCNKD